MLPPGRNTDVPAPGQSRPPTQDARSASVSVVIVNFNAGGLLLQAARSVLASDLTTELFLVDNGSTDDSLAEVRRALGSDARLHVIENGRNLGFARAANLALRQARGEYLLLLNPDCVLGQDTLPGMVAAMDAHPNAGAGGCLIRNPDGSEQAGCRRAVPTPGRSLVRVLHLDKLFPGNARFRSFVLTDQPLPEGPTKVEAISGAFMLARRAALDTVGLLDEGYFLHCEDLDWCMRFLEAQWDILFVPGYEAVHYKGTCSGRRPVRVLWHMHKGMARFYGKFFRARSGLLLMAAVYTAVWLRFGMLAAPALLRAIVPGRGPTPSSGQPTHGADKGTRSSPVPEK